MKEIQQLRRIAVKLGVSGTAIPIAETRLYKGGYGFVTLQCYVPVTQNRSPSTSPLCTVFRTTVDKFGNRKQFDNDVYNLLYVSDTEIENTKYMIFETPLPKAFTDIAGELELVFIYSEVNNENKAAVRLASGIYKTTVGDSDVSSGDTVDPTGGELARLNELTIKTENVPNLVAKIQKVAPNAITYINNSGIVSEKIVLAGGELAPAPIDTASKIEIPASAWQQPVSDGAYSVVITAAQHGQMHDGATAHDLWVSFDTISGDTVSGAYQGYTVAENGDITLTANKAVAMTVRVWNGKAIRNVQSLYVIRASNTPDYYKTNPLTLPYSHFTRVPLPNDTFDALYENTVDKSIYQCIFAVADIDEIAQTATINVTDYVQATDFVISETARAKAAEQTLQENITAEATRAEAAEQTLQGNIAAETTRAQAAEAALQSNIDESVQTLQAGISAEQERAESAEAALSARITTAQNAADTAESIARGRSQAHVFDSEADMNAWLADEANTATLNVGDNLYIKDTGVPDYWWNGTGVSELETEKPDLTPYATKTELSAEATRAQGVENELQAAVETAQSTADSKYAKPSTGIPESDLSQAVQTKLNENGAAPSASTPLMDGTGSAGTSANYARGDHRHPSDTSKANTSGTYSDLTAGNATKLVTGRYIDGVKFDGSSNTTHFCTCSSMPTDTVKVVSSLVGKNNFILIKGARITVSFTYSNTVNSPKLNVDSYGAKSIKADGDSTYVKWAADTVMEFVYDGTYWVCIGGYALQGKRVGAVYISTDSTNPEILYGGLWIAINSGYYLKAITSGSSSYGNAGLPNITGQFYAAAYGDDDASGSFLSVSKKSVTLGSSGNSKIHTIEFDAAASSPLYGDSPTVTPLNYGVYMWRRTA